MRFVWVDCTGKQLFNTTFKDFDSAWEFIDSINRDHKFEVCKKCWDKAHKRK